ncbi:MAG: hypothetical protein C4346_07285 [Chloroflexota bacterium]
MVMRSAARPHRFSHSRKRRSAPRRLVVPESNRHRLPAPVRRHPVRERAFAKRVMGCAAEESLATSYQPSAISDQPSGNYTPPHPRNLTADR